MSNETMVYYPLTDTWETVPAADDKVEPKGSTADHAADDKVEPNGYTADPEPQDHEA